VIKSEVRVGEAGEMREKEAGRVEWAKRGTTRGHVVECKDMRGRGGVKDEMGRRRTGMKRDKVEQWGERNQGGNEVGD